MTWVLGMSGSHNGAAALYRDDTLVCAVQEERLSRKKRDVLHPGRASLAVAALLADQGLATADIDLVVAAPLVDPHLPEQRPDLHPLVGLRPHLTISHHFAHALSAYACSGFGDATALVVDGMGSYARDVAEAERAVVLGRDEAARETVSIYACDHGHLVPREKHVGRTTFALDALPTRLGPFASLGLMYQQVARLTFGSWDAAGKVMGLAPYGSARFARDAFFEVASDGRLEFHDDALGIGGDLGELRPYPSDAALHADLAASTQAALEAGLMHLVRRARALTDSRRLVCAGGVFLNSVANELIVRSGIFDEVFVVPFAEDSGTAVGAAFHGVVTLLGPRVGRRLEADALGPRPTDHGAALELARANGAAVSDLRGDPGWQSLAERIAAGQAVGFFSGRSELGPRALGQRSILFDPRRPEGRAELNRLKGREAFRPFAPAVLLSHASEWFDLGATPESPFMLRVAAVHPHRRGAIPAVTHVDGSARPQTVRPDGGPLASVIEAFFALTGVPMLLDTSFNRADEPIVESACDAVRTFLGCGLHALWLDGVLIAKPGLDPELKP